MGLPGFCAPRSALLVALLALCGQAHAQHHYYERNRHNKHGRSGLGSDVGLAQAIGSTMDYYDPNEGLPTLPTTQSEGRPLAKVERVPKLSFGGETNYEVPSSLSKRSEGRGPQSHASMQDKLSQSLLAAVGAPESDPVQQHQFRARQQQFLAQQQSQAEVGDSGGIDALLQSAISRDFHRNPVAANFDVKVFALGPSSAGADFMEFFFNVYGCKSCKYQCPTEWYKNDDISSPMFQEYCSFEENGNMADHEFLAKHFADGRFLLNTRSLSSFLAIRAKQVMDMRTANGCSPFGGEVDHIYNSSDSNLCMGSGWLTNSAPYLCEWVQTTYANQEKLLRYFRLGPYKNKFAVVNIEDWDFDAATNVLQWILREDLSTMAVESQVLTAQDLGWKFDSHLDARIYEQFDKMKTQVTDPAVVDHVKNFLSQLCPKQGWHEEIYTTCGDIAKRLDCKTFKNPQGHVIGAAPLAKIGDYGDKKKDKVTHIMKTASARAGNARTLGRK